MDLTKFLKSEATTYETRVYALVVTLRVAVSLGYCYWCFPLYSKDWSLSSAFLMKLGTYDWLIVLSSFIIARLVSFGSIARGLLLKI